MKFPETKNKTVCIVGTGYTWEDCTFGNPHKDYWTLNNMYGINDLNTENRAIVVESFDEWFQLHRPNSGEGHVDDASMRSFLQSWKKPCWVQKDWGEDLQVANPWVYPIDDVIKAFCPKSASGVPYPYFTNSVDYMVCLAMLRGYEEIQFYGTDMISDVDAEYYKMRQSLNYYIGKAEGLGITVIIQPHSSLLKTGYWYAYESPKKHPIETYLQTGLEANMKDKAEAEKRMLAEQLKIAATDGGIQIINQILTLFALRDKGVQI